MQGPFNAVAYLLGESRDIELTWPSVVIHILV